ncbi:helix-turn-helix domain-containing protein [Methylomonas albis]|uniref:helix-turn-helix domain-containing protein n=1 Tax=Methylomonas albis TaxID=1854563 RepID=UPI0038994664
MESNRHVTLDLEQAAEFLHMSPAVLRQKAKAGLVRGAKPGKCWVFLQNDLADYLRSLYLDAGQAPQSGLPREVKRCHSLNAAISGGRGSQHPTASAYANRLGLTTASKPRSTTTG